MNIDRLVDNETSGLHSPGEKLENEYLTSLPTAQWSPYLDETARLLMDGISIGTTQLTTGDFRLETGDYYRSGLAGASGVDTDQTTLPIGRVSATQLAAVMWALNDLQEALRTTESANYSSSSRALEAVINKSMISSTEADNLSIGEVETIRLPKGASVTDLMSELFCRPRSDQFVETLVDVSKESRKSGKGMLQLLEEPRMVTPLWAHQWEALGKWLSEDCRGYVDMATATGKTFLGLAAIAHHFGRLHPSDAELTDPQKQSNRDTDATVVVIAHRSVILDQWKREFDRHLNIPEDASSQDGTHTARYSWGTVHFWTPQRLLETDLPRSDLVILDEAHHYVGGSGFGSILDEIDGDVLALSGSLDDANEKTLERRNIAKLFEFSLKDGQSVGIIPQCDWSVNIVPYEGQSTLEDVTKQCKAGTERFGSGAVISDLNQSTFDRSEVTFDSFTEAYSVIRTSAGRQAKEQNEDFREFAAAIQSRNLTKANLAPELTEITNLTLEHIREHKCVVLLESGDEIEAVSAGLKRELPDSFDELVVDARKYDETLVAVEEFDETHDVGALIGTSASLGEGVDIKTADVGINRSRGRLNHSLVQRIGRILRNPEGDKEASFYHVMPIPTTEDATLPKKDGSDLLETVSQLVCWGESFQARPAFESSEQSVQAQLETLESEGAAHLSRFPTEHTIWPDHAGVRDRLQRLCDDIEQQSDGSVILDIEQQQTQPEASDDVRYVSGHTDAGVQLATGRYEQLSEAIETDDLDADSVAGHVETLLRESLDAVVEERVEVPQSVVISEETTHVELNPVMRAVFRSVVSTTSLSPPEFVEWTLSSSRLEGLDG